MLENNKYAVIIHGKGGSPKTSWIPWLKHQLESQNYICITPQFPPQSNSRLLDWLTEFNKIKLNLSNTTFVAHARGAIALLRWVNSLPPNTQIHRIVIVSCNFDFQPDRKDGDEFYSKKLDYKDLKQKCKSFIVIHSENDPYVPIEAGKKLAMNLRAKFVQYKIAGHFGSDKKEAPEILREVL